MVARLLEPIDGTDSAQIAHCLGLDPGSFSKGSFWEECALVSVAFLVAANVVVVISAQSFSSTIRWKRA